MAEFLTQEEIDTLLDIAEEAEISNNIDSVKQIPPLGEVFLYKGTKKNINELSNIINISISEKELDSNKHSFLTQEEIDALLNIAEEAEYLINKHF
jgi:flagellar motor switch protein FliM